MLVNQENGDILSFLREVLERFLDRGGLGLGVDHEEIALGIRSVRHMLSNRIKSGSHDVLLRRDAFRLSRGLTPMPARRRPVTELWVPCQ